jgi:photosystem II stability/assembly factor-like uncharacterized protein
MKRFGIPGAVIILTFFIGFIAFKVSVSAKSTLGNYSMANSFPEIRSEINETRFDRLKKIGNVPHQEYGPYPTVQFINEQEGWLTVGEHLYHTPNGGSSWELIYSTPNKSDSITDIEFNDSNIGWALLSGKIHKTDDGGVTWSKLTQPFPDFPTVSFRFLEDGKRGWATGGIFILPNQTLRNIPNSYVHRDGKRILHGAIFYTDDGGNTWAKQSIPLEIGLIGGLYVLNKNLAWALSDTGIIRLNKGIWTKVSLSAARCGNRKLVQPNVDGDYSSGASVYFLDSTRGWLSLGNGDLAHSIDGGQTWCCILDAENMWSEGQAIITAYFSKIYFSGLKRGWSIDGDGNLYGTKDGGITWLKINGETKFRDIYFLDNQHGWALGQDVLYQIIL